MVRITVTSILALLVSVVVTPPANALESEAATRVVETVQNTVESTVARSGEAVVKTAEDRTEQAGERVQAQKELVEQRKAELRAAQQQRKDELRTKLEGRRLAQCQNRQEVINSLIDKSIVIGQERFEKIQRVEVAVKTFYEEKNLSSDDYSAAVEKIELEKVTAKTSLELIEEEEFDCNAVDASNPSNMIRTSREAKRGALDAYRNSVKELVVIVKDAFVRQQQAAEGRN